MVVVVGHPGGVGSLFFLLNSFWGVLGLHFFVTIYQTLPLLPCVNLCCITSRSDEDIDIDRDRHT
jgi:hypothetical protein